MRNKLFCVLLLSLLGACKEEKTFRPTSRFQLHGNIEKIVIRTLDKTSNKETDNGVEWYSDGKMDSSKYIDADFMSIMICNYQNSSLTMSTKQLRNVRGDTLTITYRYNWKSENDVITDVIVDNEMTHKEQIRYDDLGRVRFEESNTLRPEAYSSHAISYRYANDTVYIQERESDRPDRIIFSVFGNYDLKGNPQTETTYSADTVESITTYKYTYR